MTSPVKAPPEIFVPLEKSGDLRYCIYMFARLASYLSRLSMSMKILWCCLIWYVYFAIKYFEPNVELWLRSIGIAILIGVILNLHAFHSFENIRKTPNKWQVFRFFLIPFCVSSFPALIKDKGFIVFFSPSARENLTALAFCALFILSTRISRSAKRSAMFLEAD